MTNETIAIVGAGQAEATLASRLRDFGYKGRLMLIGDAHHPPYQRPPLSKTYLSGEWPAERLLLFPPAHWRDIGVDLSRCARSSG